MDAVPHYRKVSVTKRVAIVGAGPAGIYAADILTRQAPGVAIDLIEGLPAPFGLVRYGVAPDHPRIKGIIDALIKILARGDIRLLTNVTVGQDLTVAQLQDHYDAIIFATGALKDADLPIPGIELPGSFGAADFVAWYDGHPDVPRHWPLDAKQVAVIGAGNVALDVARILAKHVEDLRSTDISANVEVGLEKNQATDVHVFARRGPAQVKFSPLELRELGHVPGVDVIVYPEDFDFDDGSNAAIASSNQTKQVVKTLTDWSMKDTEDRKASRRLHIHMLHATVAITGDGRVESLRTERTRLTGDGSVTGTGEFFDWPMDAVYRAVGYFGSQLDEVPYDELKGVIPNVEGRIVSDEGTHLPGLYATGWIKRGPVGLIGATKSDAAETIRHLVADLETLPPAPARDQDIIAVLDQHGTTFATWDGWMLLDAYERALGEAKGRVRTKVVPRDEMNAISRGIQLPGETES